MKYYRHDGVEFNCDAVKTMSEKEFTAHPMHDHHWKHIRQPKERLKVLKMVYKKIVGKQATEDEQTETE